MPSNPARPCSPQPRPAVRGRPQQACSPLAPLPYGGEHAAEPDGDHPDNTHNHTPRGDHRGEEE